VPTLTHPIAPIYSIAESRLQSGVGAALARRVRGVPNLEAFRGRPRAASVGVR
jgi:hypothetical protein